MNWNEPSHMVIIYVDIFCMLQMIKRKNPCDIHEIEMYTFIWFVIMGSNSNLLSSQYMCDMLEQCN